VHPRSRLWAVTLVLAAPIGLGVTPAPLDLPPGIDWAGYNKTLDGQRFSSLKQIDTSNAATLAQACRVEVAHRGSFQAGPVLVNDLMYVTAEEQTVALNPVTCAIRWRHVYHHQQAGIIAINRGVAYANDRLFRGTDDARVIALDATTGRELWTSVAGDPTLAEYISGAPLAWNGLVFVGTAGSEFGVRGRVLAFEADSGREVWRFNTIPTGTETGAETWRDSDWASHGGGGTWSSFALDPSTAELFIPVGNPIPAFSPQDRPGDNLFTDSVVVLDAHTGAVKWWYQLTPSDSADWDLAAAPMLFRNDDHRNMVALAGKDGYLHVVDRQTHQLAFKVATTTVDAPPLAPTSSGTRRCPGAAGGTEWNGPAFDPLRSLIFTGAIDMCTVIVTERGQSYAPGKMHYGGSWSVPNEPGTGWISAFDANTGRLKWKYHTEAVILGALTATAGGLLLGGDNAGNFLVFDSATGKVLKKAATGGSISGGIITYAIGGRQYIALTSGNISRTGFGALGRPSIIVMAAEQRTVPARSNRPDPNHGREVYQHTCVGCHASDGTGVSGFSLQNIKSRMTTEQLVAWIRNPRPPMPKAFAEPLEEDDLRDLADLAAYLQTW